MVLLGFFKQTRAVLDPPGNKGKAEEKLLRLYPAYRQRTPRPGTRGRAGGRAGSPSAGSRLRGRARRSATAPRRGGGGGRQETHGREAPGQEGLPGGAGWSATPGLLPSERACGRAGSASPRALPPPQASACEPPLARPHGRSLSPLPDQSHYSHVAHGPGGAATRAGRCVTAAKRSGEGARPSRPPRAAHAAGASVATATAWPPPLSGPSSRGRPGDCLSGREARRAAAAPGRGGPRLPRPCRPAGAAEAGGGRAGGRAGGGADAEAARGAPMAGRAGQGGRAGRPGRAAGCRGGCGRRAPPRGRPSVPAACPCPPVSSCLLRRAADLF